MELRITEICQALQGESRSVGVPTVFGAGGVERATAIKMTKDEQALFNNSVHAVNVLALARKRIDAPLA